jgi:hypothetical protein
VTLVRFIRGDRATIGLNFDNPGSGGGAAFSTSLQPQVIYRCEKCSHFI